LLKTGAYGLLRFVVPLFPGAAVEIAPWAMLFGVIGILYGAILAFSQTDFKRLVAYTSVSHMGFVMLGVFSFNELAWQGVVMQMITHGISTGALFILAGNVYERIHTRDIEKMGGFWPKMPFMATVAMVFAMASLGLPGLGNFVAEFLTLLGAWQANKVLTVFAAIGLVGATAYSLRIIQKVFYGPETAQHHPLTDLSGREKIVLVPMVAAIVWLGLFPQPVLNTSKKTVLKNLETTIAKHPAAEKQMQQSSALHKKGGPHE
jgi:NADH-quinone oxidoreductase subunit M